MARAFLIGHLFEDKLVNQVEPSEAKRVEKATIMATQTVVSILYPLK